MYFNPNLPNHPPIHLPLGDLTEKEIQNKRGDVAIHTADSLVVQQKQTECKAIIPNTFFFKEKRDSLVSHTTKPTLKQISEKE